MDEIEEFKKFLGPIAKDYNDARLHQLQREMYAMAALLLDIYLHKQSRKRNRNRTGKLLTEAEQAATIPA